jgi:RNA polymerase sigma-70 factor (ECF subfamily)
LAGDEQHGEVLNAVRALPALYREPFVLRHLNNWTYQEIADVMGMPVDSVETRLVRARRLLREALKDKLA